MDAVASILIENLVEILLNEGRQVLEFHDQFKTVKQELTFMRSYLKDIDKVRKKDQKEILKTISRELRELLYDAEDIIADCELFLKQQRRRRASKCMSYCSPSFLKVRRRMGKRLQQINQDIKTNGDRMRTYLGSLPNQEHNESSRSMTHPVLMSGDNVVGLDNDANEIKQWILKAHGPLTVIGIVGMGGIGKTTLAEKMSDNNSVKAHFHHILFVSISQSFVLKDVIRNMLIKLKVNEDALPKDERGLLEELRGQLSEKRYLVILDDVWEIDEDPWWESLKSALPQKNDGSCVVVTTRNKNVAQSMGAAETHIHHPEILSDEDSWSLFAKIAFAREGGQCPNPKFVGIGKKIVAKCGGLPLAIKVVGGMMQGKDFHTWKQIFGNLEELKSNEAIIYTLKLSYEELPAHLKPCILSFSVFPEDFEISRNDMVRWWIGEGFVRGKGERNALEIGNVYFDELINRCLLIGVQKDFWERRFETCKVHDMVRDMIIKMAEEESFMGLDDNGSESRRVGIVRSTGMNFSGKTNLRTVVGIEVEESEEFAINVVPKLWQLTWLRVLNISFKGIDEDEGHGLDLLSGIGSLPHLICLEIEHSQLLEKFPNSIGSLQNLKVLCFRDCPKLKRLPVQVTSLEKLTVLICDYLECLPMGIGNLSQLEELNPFVPTNSRCKDAARMTELKKLTQLRKLRLNIKSEDQFEERELEVLSYLKKLEELILNFEVAGIIEKEKLIRKVDYELPPIQNLQELTLWSYPGERTPVWLNPTCLTHLRFLIIFEGELTHLSPGFFGKSEEKKVWELEGLWLYGLSELGEEWPTMQRGMPSLRLLRFRACPKLKSLPSCDDGDGLWCTWRKEEEKNGVGVGMGMGTSGNINE